MNCCNAFGKCTGGHDCAAHTCPPCNHDCNQGRTCPARCTHAPEEADSTTPFDHMVDVLRVVYLAAYAALVFASIAMLAGSAGYLYQRWVA